MPVADALEITEIDTLSPSDTDTWFPEIISAEWNVVSEEQFSRIPALVRNIDLLLIAAGNSGS